MWRPWSGEEERLEESDIDVENWSDIEEQIITSEGKIHHKTFLSDDAKQIVKNVFESLKASGNSERGLVMQTANLTKVAYSTVQKIVRSDVTPRKVRCDAGVCRALDEVRDADLIRRAVYDFYEKKVLPTISVLYNKLKKDNTIDCSGSMLRIFLKKIGFKYKKVDKRVVIMESERLKSK